MHSKGVREVRVVRVVRKVRTVRRVRKVRTVREVREVRRVRMVGGMVAVALMCVSLGARVQGVVVERVLALVAGQVITLADVRAAIELGLVQPPGGDPVAATLDELIERELILTEVERYVPPEPAPDLVDRRIERVRTAFPSRDAFARAMARGAMTEERLRDFVRDDLRIATYLDQRFGAAEQVTNEDIEDYYTEHLEEFRREGDPLPLAKMRESIRQHLIAERRHALIRQWISGLRRRAEIISLYVSGRL